MRSTTLTALFFALFALFSTVAFAAPVDPQGAITKRQCTMSSCRNATPGTPGSDTPPDTSKMINNIIISLLQLINGQPGTPAPAAAAASSSVSTPLPTGV